MNRRHYLIVGGTKGIGKECVKSFASEGNDISVLARNTLPGDNPNVRYFQTDLSDSESLKAGLSCLFSDSPKLSHIVFFQRFRGSGDDWEQEFKVSLSATKLIIESCVEHFDESSERSIVVTSSRAADMVAHEQPLSYHVAKAGLNQLVRYYALYLADKGIRVNAVTPGTVLKEESRDFYLNNEALHDFYKKIIPLGRMGTSEDIVNVIRFLCSTSAAFITGQNIVIDGGSSLYLHESLCREVAGLPRVPGKTLLRS